MKNASSSPHLFVLQVIPLNFVRNTHIWLLRFPAKRNQCGMTWLRYLLESLEIYPSKLEQVLPLYLQSKNYGGTLILSTISSKTLLQQQLFIKNRQVLKRERKWDIWLLRIHGSIQTIYQPLLLRPMYSTVIQVHDIEVFCFLFSPKNEIWNDKTSSTTFLLLSWANSILYKLVLLRRSGKTEKTNSESRTRKWSKPNSNLCSSRSNCFHVGNNRLCGIFRKP